MPAFLIPSLWLSLKRLIFRLSSHHSKKTGLIEAATDHPSLSAPFTALTFLTGQPASLSNSLPGLLASSLGGGLLFSFSCTCFFRHPRGLSPPPLFFSLCTHTSLQALHSIGRFHIYFSIPNFSPEFRPRYLHCLTASQNPTKAL